MAKKKHFGFLIFLFILYNNFIINYKTVHTLAQLTNTLASTNTKQSLFTCCLGSAQLTSTNTKVFTCPEPRTDGWQSSGCWTWLCHLLRTWIRHPRDVVAALCPGSCFQQPHLRISVAPLFLVNFGDQLVYTDTFQ